MNDFNELKGIVRELKTRYLQQQEECNGLKEEVRLKNEELKEKKQEYQALREQCERLKLVNSMLGGTEAPREAKLKINKLVREIDKCIALLNK